MLTYKDFVKFVLRACLIKNFGFSKLPIVDGDEMEELLEDFEDDIFTIEDICLKTCYGDFYPLYSLNNLCLVEVLVEGRDEVWGILKETLDRLLTLYPEMKTTPPISAPTWIDHEYKYFSQFKQCQICRKMSAFFLFIKSNIVFFCFVAVFIIIPAAQHIMIIVKRNTAMSSLYISICDDHITYDKGNFYLSILRRLSVLFYKFHFIVFDKKTRDTLNDKIKIKDDFINCKNVKIMLVDSENRDIRFPTVNRSFTMHLVLWYENDGSSDEVYNSYFVERYTNMTRNLFVRVFTFKITNDNFDTKTISGVIEKFHDMFFQQVSCVERDRVVVVDLDDTLIDAQSNLLLKDHINFFARLSFHFNRIILWSHGNRNHVYSMLRKYNLEKFFDIIIFRSDDETDYSCCRNKGFGYVMRLLNEKYGTIGIEYNCLIDDLSHNNTGDYMYNIVVPVDRKLDYDIFFAKSISTLFKKHKKCL